VKAAALVVQESGGAAHSRRAGCSLVFQRLVEIVVEIRVFFFVVEFEIVRNVAHSSTS
jgi:hypothetical protein